MSDSASQVCDSCRGRGFEELYEGGPHDYPEGPRYYTEPCWRCKGTGSITQERRQELAEIDRAMLARAEYLKQRENYFWHRTRAIRILMAVLASIIPFVVAWLVHADVMSPGHYYRRVPVSPEADSAAGYIVGFLFGVLIAFMFYVFISDRCHSFAARRAAKEVATTATVTP